ncbi:hypothetical protein DdX_18864 [Ditylenchus destructor]|uniref:Uncharacterized protein n=1 Tax=Ditylenchus destructor TaxID=166010 RepID=A0AAD4MJX0_9BILA|nr:hypothetical protein DdX_18864 [Ditylenchus destructor]
MEKPSEHVDQEVISSPNHSISQQKEMDQNPLHGQTGTADETVISEAPSEINNISNVGMLGNGVTIEPADDLNKTAEKPQQSADVQQLFYFNEPPLKPAEPPLNPAEKNRNKPAENNAKSGSRKASRPRKPRSSNAIMPWMTTVSAATATNHILNIKEISDYHWNEIAEKLWKLGHYKEQHVSYLKKRHHYIQNSKK